ncbi:MAG: SEC-C domain-containing protein [Eubacteriaceae bacterium]|jgi:uncharacterized protein YecA (UPF0149 family)|nr:SEC-C domain-containing protein [Eubacteriaceae bacterium]
MSLYSEWKELIENQSNDSIDKFWQEYSDAETRIYSGFLDDYQNGFSGNFKELADKYETRPVIFMGFLDGAQQSISNPFELEGITEESDIELDFELEKLLYNMMKAGADYLYSLPQWETILGKDKVMEIAKEYKKSKTVVKKKKPGRNEPCWCGSGKKYKYCHMQSDEEEEKKAQEQ